MKLRGSLATVEAVSTRRPLMLLAVTALEAGTGLQACHAISNHAPMTGHVTSMSSALPEGAVKVATWIVATLAIAMWLLTTPGYFKFKGAQRRQLDDELVLHNRARAVRLAFFTLAICTLLAAVAAAGGRIENWWAVAALTTSLCVGAVTFAVLEWRANA